MARFLLRLRMLPSSSPRCLLSSTNWKAIRKDVDNLDEDQTFSEYESKKGKKRRLLSKANALFLMRKIEGVPMHSNISLIYYFQPGLYFIPSQFLISPLMAGSVYISVMDTALPLWAILGSYYFTVLLMMLGRLMMIAPIRIYHDEAADRTFATFANPLIPLKFFKVDLPHHSYKATGYFFQNDNHKYFIQTQYFRSIVDVNRLLKRT